MGTGEYLKKILETWETSTIDLLPRIILAVVVFFLFFVLGRIVRGIVLKFYSKLPKAHPDVAQIISSCIYFFFLLSGMFLALEILGLEQLLTKCWPARVLPVLSPALLLKISPPALLLGSC